MGRTSLCPDKCGHSSNLASFTITDYLEYKKPGQYGDPKATTFLFMTEDNMGNAKISPELLKTVKELKKGDLVHLTWNTEILEAFDLTSRFDEFPEGIEAALENMRELKEIVQTIPIR